MPRPAKLRIIQTSKTDLTNPESSNMARPEAPEPSRDRAETNESEQSLRVLDELRQGMSEELDESDPEESEPPTQQKGNGKEPQTNTRARYSILPDEPVEGITVVNIATFEDFTRYCDENPRGLHVAILGALSNRITYRKEALGQRVHIQSLNEQIRELIGERDEIQHELLQALRKLNSQPTASGSAPVARETSSKTAKLPDPEKYNGPSNEKDKDGVDLEDWLAKVRRKLQANQDHYHSEELRMGYVQNMVGGIAAKHLAPRLRSGAANPFAGAEEMLKTLEQAYGNPHKRQDAADDFRRLYQNNTPFHTFWAEFQRLAAETEMPESTQLEELGYRVSAELQHALLAVNDVGTVYELAQRCMTMDAKIQRLKKIKARGSGKNSGGPSTSSTTSGGASGQSTVKNENGTPGSAPPSTNRSRPTYDTAEKQQLSREGKCFYCKGVGHLARECPNKAARINEVGGGTAAASAPQAPSNPPSSSQSEN
jgi:hypothetical protein